MRPKINTSYRSHGKWGDFLACVVPIIWCMNILTNSSFILRLMEWQNESSLFTVRIRGRQWYWVYKFELKHIADVLSAPRNIGNNQWVIMTGESLEVSDNYFYSLRLRNQNVWLKNYWNNYVKNFVKQASLNNDAYFDALEKEHYSVMPALTLENFKNIVSQTVFLEELQYPRLENSLVSDLHEVAANSKLLFNDDISLNKIKNLAIISNKLEAVNYHAQMNILVDWLIDDIVCNSESTNLMYASKNTEYVDTSRFQKRIITAHQPIVVSKALLDLEKSTSFKQTGYDTVNLFFNKEKSIIKKVPNEQFFLTLKQKRYKRKKVIPMRMRFSRNIDDFKIEKIKLADKPCFVSTNFLKSINFEPTKTYRLLKKNKIRHEAMPVQLSRRLLRTKKTLVLPAHVNLTLVTNSYDVIHSWFLPALGVKIDCVPGRSTHHVFYCDNVGFYYGQCAEICGRYHHHMPIRLCALPFEHFIIWWQHFGITKVLAAYNKKRYELKFINKTFSW